MPALMMIDAAVRHLPGALNDATSAEQESFAAGLLDCPHYTRPEVFEGQAVPDVLVSGHHQRIARWRREQSLLATLRKRPDLIEAARLEGARGWAMLWHVVLPQLRPAIIAGGLLAFTFSFDDYVIASFVAGPRFEKSRPKASNSPST